MVWEEEQESPHGVLDHEVDMVSIIPRKHHLNETIMTAELFIYVCNDTYVVSVEVPE